MQTLLNDIDICLYLGDDTSERLQPQLCIVLTKAIYNSLDHLRQTLIESYESIEAEYPSIDLDASKDDIYDMFTKVSHVIISKEVETVSTCRKHLITLS